ncbi:MAG: class I SAM-dependent methyltransferase [Terracidiphilus sp.]
MTVAEAIRSLSSVPPLLRTIDNIPMTASPADLVDISLGCPAIQSQQIRSEFLELAKMVKAQQCKYIMEIGTYRGGTLFVFSQLADPHATVISLDFHFSFLGKVYGALQKPLLRKFVRNGKSLFLLRQDSHLPETEQVVRDILKDNELDFLFIDGDHTYEGVRADFTMYSPLVREGGLIAFHDIAESGGSREVHRLWEELKPNYRHSEFIHKTGSGAMGIGVLLV